MDVAEHLAFLSADGALLRDAAAQAGWDAPVPGTDWTVRELVKHVGGVHRWAAEIVRTAAPNTDIEAGRAVGTGPADPELLEWFDTGHQALVEALTAAPADLDCVAFLPAASPLAFWARRQAHETAVHRADAQAAAALVPQFDIAFAQDGIGEMLAGFARRRSNAVATPGQLALRPVDSGSPWLITFGGEQILGVKTADIADASASVSGTSADLYLWLWNRPARVDVVGDAAIAELWRTVRVRWN